MSRDEYDLPQRGVQDGFEVALANAFYIYFFSLLLSQNSL